MQLCYFDYFQKIKKLKILSSACVIIIHNGINHFNNFGLEIVIFDYLVIKLRLTIEK